MNMKKLMILALLVVCLSASALAVPYVYFSNPTPASGTNSTSAALNVNWTVVDLTTANTALSCNLTFTGSSSGATSAQYKDLAVTNNTAYNYSLTLATNGRYNYSVACINAEDERNTSNTRYYTYDSTGPSITPTLTVLSAASGATSGTYQLTATVSDALMPLSSVRLTVDGVVYTPTTLATGSYGKNVTWAVGSTHTYSWFANDTLANTATSSATYEVDSTSQCDLTKDVIFAAFSLIALFGLVAGAYVLITFGELNATTLTATTVAVIGLGLIVFIGYTVISNVAVVTC